MSQGCFSPLEKQFIAARGGESGSSLAFLKLCPEIWPDWRVPGRVGRIVPPGGGRLITRREAGK